MPRCLCRTVIVISIMDKQNNKCNIWGINTIENLFIIGWFIAMTSSCSLLSIYSKHSILNIFSIMVFLYTTHSIPSFFIIIFSLYHTVFLYTTLLVFLYTTLLVFLYTTLFVFLYTTLFLLYHTVCFSLYHTVFCYTTLFVFLYTTLFFFISHTILFIYIIMFTLYMYHSFSLYDKLYTQNHHYSLCFLDTRHIIFIPITILTSTAVWQFLSTPVPVACICARW